MGSNARAELDRTEPNGLLAETSGRGLANDVEAKPYHQADRSVKIIMWQK